MSIPVLTQVYDEVRRLAIAGSVVAGGDFRLKKLVPPLEQAGQKAPVFAKVAQSVTKLVESSEKTSAEALLELSTLVNAILYTQGESGIAGDIKPLETTDLGQQQTQASARVLKPLLEALSTTGSGRLEIIRDAIERGAFRDLRLIKPALEALDDSYSEVGDLVAGQILPLYGQAIFPELKAKFQFKGKGGHLRRLALMHKLDPEGTREIVKQALDEGSKEMKVAAIECLGTDPEDLSYLLEQAKSKAKDVREAALKSLSRIDSGEAVGAIEESIKDGEIDLAIQPVRESKSPRLVKFVLDEAQTQLAALLAKKEKDKKVVTKQVERLLALLECLRGRTDKPTEASLLAWFGKREEIGMIKGDLSGQDIQQRLAQIMGAGPKGAQLALVAAHKSLSSDEFPHAFLAACRAQQPDEVFETFSSYLTAKVDEKKKGRDPAYACREAISDNLKGGWRRYHYDPADDEEAAARKLDPRWLDVAVKIGDLDLVQALARPGHAAANNLLAKAFDEKLARSKDAYDCGQVLRTMVQVQHPAATKSMIAALTKLAKGANPGWAVYWFAPVIPQLPKEAVPELEALLPTLPEKAIDQLLDYITQLKNKT